MEKGLTHGEKLRLAGIKRYGSEEAWKQAQRESGALARRDTPRGFKVLKEKDPERMREIAVLGGKSGRRDYAKEKRERLTNNSGLEG